MRDFATDAFDANPRPFVGLPGPWIEPEYLNATGIFDTAKRFETGTKVRTIEYAHFRTTHVNTRIRTLGWVANEVESKIETHSRFCQTAMAPSSHVSFLR